ncbi:MAG: FHA domain-containing protein [Myxococcota bacterium]
MGIRLSVRSSWTGEASAEYVYEFDQLRVVIGRQGGADVCLPHPAVSAPHAVIASKGAGYAVEDMGSTNGTRVNGDRLPPKRQKKLAAGDRIEIGGFVLEFAGGVAVSQPTSSIRTGTLARAMLRRAFGSERPAVGVPELRVDDGPDKGTVHALPEGRTVVGRSETADLVLTDADASREHLEIEWGPDGFVARDLGSKNGLIVNGKTLTTRTLRDGDVLAVGASTMTFVDPAAAALRALAEEPDEVVAQLPEAPDASPGPEPGAPEEPAKASPPNQVPTAPPKPSRSADLIIYLLAGAVLILSVIALFVLLRGN